jgi:hypothetical protein
MNGAKLYINEELVTDLSIPADVYGIGSHAFNGCSSLKSVKVLATTPPAAYSSTFSEVTGATLYVPEEAVNTYKTTKPWSNFDTIIGF